MEPTPITVPLRWRHGLDLIILYKRESGFFRLDVFYWVQRSVGQIYSKVPRPFCRRPLLGFILFSWCLGHDKPQVLFSLEDPLYSGYPFYFVPHPRDGGSSFLFCCKLLIFTLYFGLSVGLGFTYSLSSLGIWVWPFESSCSHLLGDSPCFVGLEFMKKGVSTLLFLWIKFFYTNFEVLYRTSSSVIVKDWGA